MNPHLTTSEDVGPFRLGPSQDGRDRHGSKAVAKRQ
jgi:hypothetical protein